jgi:hypothetical protein
MSMTVMAAETHEVSRALSYGIGVGTLAILLLLLGALVAFGGGREHT